MKRILVAILALGLLGTSVWSQNLSDVSKEIDKFGAAVTGAVPMSALTGLSWSESYIGSLIGIPPHFGVGISGGMAFIPIDSVKSITSTLGVNLPAVVTALPIGIPLPSYTIEGRVGGILLPFDVGLKVGLLPADTKNLTGDFSVDYLMIGGDVRYALLEDSLITPAVSVGLGYTYLKGGVFMGLPDITLGSVPTGPSTTSSVALSKPKLGVLWENSTIDLKAQVSKNLIVVTPYAGAGLSYSMMKAGAGFYATPTIGGTAMTPAQMDYLKANFPGGADVVDVSSNGIQALFNQDGAFALRVYGGASLNIIVLRIDLSAMYNVLSNSLGANLGLRIQL